jgi:hypothetical protein
MLAMLSEMDARLPSHSGRGCRSQIRVCDYCRRPRITFAAHDSGDIAAAVLESIKAIGNVTCRKAA